MSYSDFTLPKISKTFSLIIQEKAEIFSHIPPIDLDPYFQNYLKNNIPLAQAIGTEKAKSEMIIAPVLIETRQLLNNQISLFSGIDFNVDIEQGLNGFCDFILSLSPQQLYLVSPVIALVEAKNDNLKSGLAQCIAEMFAAQLFNLAENNNIKTVYGVVTNGNQWQFLRLVDHQVEIDITDYYISQPEKIIGILVHVIRLEKQDN